MSLQTATIGELLKQASQQLACAGIETPDLDARLLLEEASGLSANEIIGGHNTDLEYKTINTYQSMIERRLSREPVHRILGKREFYGREFLLSSETLVPRPDSETLIDVIRHEYPDRGKRIRVLDLGTGSGVLGISIACEYENASVVAVDFSRDAVQTATQNAQKLGVDDRVDVIEGDLFTPVDGCFDLIVSNPPYIASDEMGALQSEVRLHDPALALDGGVDGLVFYRKIFEQAGEFLTGPGVICLEIGSSQGRNVCIIAKQAGYSCAPIVKDLSGNNRVIVAKKSV